MQNPHITPANSRAANTFDRILATHETEHITDKTIRGAISSGRYRIAASSIRRGYVSSKGGYAEAYNGIHGIGVIAHIHAKSGGIRYHNILYLIIS